MVGRTPEHSLSRILDGRAPHFCEHVWDYSNAPADESSCRIANHSQYSSAHSVARAESASACGVGPACAPIMSPQTIRVARAARRGLPSGKSSATSSGRFSRFHATPRSCCCSRRCGFLGWVRSSRRLPSAGDVERSCASGGSTESPCMTRRPSDKTRLGRSRRRRRVRERRCGVVRSARISRGACPGRRSGCTRSTAA